MLTNIVCILTKKRRAKMNSIDINLDLEPFKRWEELSIFKEEVKELGEQILIDLLPQFNSITSLAFKAYRKGYANTEYMRELKGMAKILDYNFEHLCLLNFYYDLLKIYFDGLSCWGCSAFVCNTPNGPIHVRNLDWPSDGDLLSSYSLKQNYYKNGKLIFSAIGWPAYNSVLSGCGAGRFSITLNTVSSREKAQWAKSVTYLIREVFEKCLNYNEAVKLLSETRIMSDCILTVCGVNIDEFCVIERSPTKFEIRKQKNWVIATNDYRTPLQGIRSELGVMLSGDSCDRYDTLQYQLEQNSPKTIEAAVEYIKHPFVKNEITMQHMAFHPSSGIVASEYGKAPSLSLKPLIYGERKNSEPFSSQKISS